MKINNRMCAISEYHFQRMDEIKSRLRAEGREIVDLSVGDPDLPVNQRIIDSLIEGFKAKEYNRYPPYDGIIELKKQVIKYYESTYSVSLNLDEVIILIGSKEGINNIIPSICNIGDYALIPELGYPVYETCCNLWGVKSYKIPLTENKNYLPSIEYIPEDIAAKCKLFIINYPNNPTGATANSEFYKDIIKYCSKYNIVLCNDGAYNEIIPEDRNPISILQFDEKKQCIEFGTFSKTFNMTGFRIGYAVGNSEVIRALLKVKSNVDSGQFIPIQLAAAEALNIERDYINTIRSIYDERRNSAKTILKEHNISYFDGSGTFYIWCRVPKNYICSEFCEELLYKNSLLVTPGYIFNKNNYDCFRISLTQHKEKINNALNSLKIYD